MIAAGWGSASIAAKNGEAWTSIGEFTKKSTRSTVRSMRSAEGWLNGGAAVRLGMLDVG